MTLRAGVRRGLVGRARRLFASRASSPLLDGAAATDPSGTPSGSMSGGGMFAAVRTPLRGVERVHGGSADLEEWPASAVELELATRCATDVDDLVAARELYDVCGSAQRATAVVLQVRRAGEADRLLLRAFGIDQSVVRS